MTKGQWHGGKGSQTRPGDSDKFRENYDLIFGKKNKPVKPDGKSSPQKDQTA